MNRIKWLFYAEHDIITEHGTSATGLRLRRGWRWLRSLFYIECKFETEYGIYFTHWLARKWWRWIHKLMALVISSC
jgi:hypothetical protein